MRITTLWREPLLHFLLLGLALFLYYDLAGESTEAPPKRIHVDRGQVQQLAANFERTWSRPPTPQELDAMVEGHVREEVFYREALALGLDRDDPLVRRRMRMKLEFMLEDLSAQDYSDDVLNDYMQQHADRFRSETQVSLRQVYLNPDRRPDLDADAAQLLAHLNDGAAPDTLGDPTMAPRFYQLSRQSEISRDFGEEFAREVAALPPGDWVGPLYSPFGAHLVKIDARIDARLPALVEIRERVLAEYQAGQRKQQKDVAYQKLREGYEVTVEPLSATDSAGGGIVTESNAGESQ
ncbi:MAG: peptidyl-prolyl cis-trans isomerase [Gammaproteobacteria bacterium]